VGVSILVYLTTVESGCDELALSSWGLPSVVVQRYERRGVSHMFPWQAECLTLGNVLGKFGLCLVCDSY